MSALKETIDSWRAGIGRFFVFWWPLILIAVVCTVGCFYSIRHPRRPVYTTTIRFDGCEYLKTDGPRSSYTLTHKGNCTNH